MDISTRFYITMIALTCSLAACQEEKPAPKPVYPSVITPQPKRTYSEKKERARSKRLAQQEFQRRPTTSKEALPFEYHVHFKDCNPAQCVEVTQDLGWSPFSYETALLGFPIWLQACIDEVAVACKYTAQVYQDGRLTLDSEPKVTPFSDRKQESAFLFYMRRACLLDTVHCTHWAEHTLDQKHISTRLISEAKARLTINCQKNDVRACAALAFSYKEVTGLPQDLKLARLYYKRSCEMNGKPDSRYCGAATLMMLKGQGGEEQPQQAMEILGDLCDPNSESWKQRCPGNPDTLEQACDVFKMHHFGPSCIYAADHMRTQGPEGRDKAARIQSALCTSMLLRDTQPHYLHACQQAQAHHIKQRSPLEHRRRLQARHCELKQDICISTQQKGVVECINDTDRCTQQIEQ